VGKLRDETKYLNKNLNAFRPSNSVRLDCPRWPAQILLDDIEQKIITDTGFDFDEGLYMYKIEPYPESHHI